MWALFLLLGLAGSISGAVTVATVSSMKEVDTKVEVVEDKTLWESDIV